MKIDIYVKDIAAAATPENLVADDGDQFTKARRVRIHCPTANTSDLTLLTKKRGGTTGITIVKGTTYELPMPIGTGQGGRYDLREIMVKAGTNGDDVQIEILDPITE